MKRYLLVGGGRDGHRYDHPEHEQPPEHVHLVKRDFDFTPASPGDLMPTERYHLVEIKGDQAMWWFYVADGLTLDDALFYLMNGYVGKRT